MRVQGGAQGHWLANFNQLRLSNRVSAGVVLLRILQAAPCYASFLQLGVCFGNLGGGFRGALCRLMAGTGLPGHGTLNRRRRGPQVKDHCHCSWRVVFGLPACVDADSWVM